MIGKYRPLMGMAVSVCFFVAATAVYPGGTLEHADSAGYDWMHNFVSTLFAPVALNGAPNRARYPAILSMLFFCVSVGALFEGISKKTRAPFHRKTIQIFGIGSMVYAFLVVTPLHDALVAVSLLFFMVAVAATLHVLFLERQRALLAAGLICFVLLLISSVMYYGVLRWDLLPAMQKATFGAYCGWLIALRYDFGGWPGLAMEKLS